MPAGKGAATNSILVISCLIGSPSPPTCSCVILSPYFRGDIRAASHFRASIRNLERYEFRIHPDRRGFGIRHRVTAAIVRNLNDFFR